MRNVEMDEKRSLWSQIPGLLEKDLAQRRSTKVFVRDIRVPAPIHSGFIAR
jgi:hypothetical protein